MKSSSCGDWASHVQTFELGWAGEDNTQQMANCKVVLRVIVQLGSIYHVSNGCSLHFFFLQLCISQLKLCPGIMDTFPLPLRHSRKLGYIFLKKVNCQMPHGLDKLVAPPPPPLKKWPVEVVQEYFIFFVFRLTFNETKASSVLARSHFS